MFHKCTSNSPPNGHHLHNFVIQHHTAHSQCMSKRCLGKLPFEKFSHKSVVQRHVSLTPLCSLLDLHCPFLVVPPWSSLVVLLCSLWPFLMVPSSWSLPGGSFLMIPRRLSSSWSLPCGPFLVVSSWWTLPCGSFLMVPFLTVPCGPSILSCSTFCFLLSLLVTFFFLFLSYICISLTSIKM